MVYNMFHNVFGTNCALHLLFNLDKCKHLKTKSEKFKFAVDSWNSSSIEERAIWVEKAKGLQTFDASQLTEKQRKHQIFKARKQLISQVYSVHVL